MAARRAVAASWSTYPSAWSTGPTTTRTAISDAALALSLEVVVEQVSVTDIAEAADVAITTLFQHLGSKEAMVFELDDDLERTLVSAVAQRRVDQSVLDAL